MTAEDSKRVAFEKQELDDTLSCCVCTEFYSDPKALPCIHTFCMKCLQQIGHNANKGPGDEMPCPICRRQFKIPQEGFSGLPNNFFIAKLIEVANVSNPSESSSNLCDVCMGNDEETRCEIPEAHMFCIDCNQKLCEECCRHHRKSKLSKNHKLIQINELQLNSEFATTSLAPSVCELHDQKALDIYCAECKTVQCAVCFIDRHKHLEGSHVSKYVDDFRKEIESKIETINQCSSKIQMKKAELNEIKEEMQQKVERLEEDVIKRRDEVKQLADSQANSLLQKLSSLRQSKLKEIQMEADAINAHLTRLQSYSSYCKKMMDKGSASDIICRAVSDLSVKAAKLQEQSQSLIEREIKSFKFCFTKSEFEEFLEDDNLIEEIEEDSKSRQKATATPKVALIRKQSNEIELLKDDINLERRGKETFRLENEQLQMTANNEKEANKMSRNELIRNLASYSAEISQLKLDMDKEKTTIKTLQANTEKRIKQLNEELACEKTKYKTLQDGNKKLGQELETQQKAMQDLLKGKEQETKDCEKTKTGSMENDEIKHRILNVYAKFVSDVESDRLSDHLVQRAVISIEQWQRISRKNPISSDKCRALLNHLFSTQHPSAFLIVREALSEQNHYLLEYISKREQECGILVQPDTGTFSQDKQKIEQQQKDNEGQKRAWKEEKDRLLKTQKELETKLEWGAKTLDLEQKQEEERKTSTKEKEELISQIQEHHRLMDKLRSEYQLDATLVQTIRTKAAEQKKSIQGLTILDNELFVVSEKSSEVEVYDSMKFSFSRRWSLKELIQPQDIVSCGRNKCLYIFDYKGYLSWSNGILRVGPNGNLIKKWSTGNNFGYSLSVTGESNVILPVYNARQLNEYSPDGQLVRELNIQSGPESCEIWHAVKLTSGDFVVSYRSTDLLTGLLGPPHGVCIVDGVGKRKKLFGGKTHQPLDI